MTLWQNAQIHERAHWERLIAGVRSNQGAFWFDLWQEQADFLWPLLERLVGINDEDVIVEIGAGLMGMVRYIDKGKRFIIDPLGKMQQEAHDKLFGEIPEVRVFSTRAESRIDVEDVSIVLAMDCLDHCESPPKVLEGVHSMLKPEGLFCESTTIFKEPTEWVDNDYGKFHPWNWDWPEFSQLMSSAALYLFAIYRHWPCHPGFKGENSNSHQYLRIWKKLWK